jgi:polar amino acid transport system permease protein
MPANSHSGIESIPKGQWEAGYCVGMNGFDIMRFIIFPQAFRIFLPTVMGFYIGAIKDTSIVSLVGCNDIVKQSKIIINQTSLPMQTYLIIALIFFAISYPMSLFVTKLEKRRAHS